MGVAEMEKQRWNGCPTGDGRVEVVAPKLVEMGRGGTGQGRDRTKRQSSNRCRGGLGINYGLGDSNPRSLILLESGRCSYIYLQDMRQPVNHQSSPFSSLSHVKPSNREVLDVHGFRVEVVKVTSSRVKSSAIFGESWKHSPEEPDNRHQRRRSSGKPDRIRLMDRIGSSSHVARPSDP